MQPPPPPAAVQYAPPGAGYVAVPQRRGCRRGCLIALLVLALAIGVPVALVLRVPQALGIWRSHPEAVFDQTPDPVAGAALVGNLQASGTPTDGLRIYIFRQPDSSARIAYATAALAENFSFRDTGDRDPLLDLLGQIAIAAPSADNRIDNVALLVRDFDGKSMMVVIASAEDARAYAAGQLDEGTFLDRITGWVDTGVLTQSQLGGGEP